MSQSTAQPQSVFRRWLRGTLAFLAFVVIVRFVLEVAGVPATVTRYFSSSAAVFLAAIYLGAIAPLRGVNRFVRLIVGAIVVTAWAVGWVVLATFVSGVFQLQRSHFVERADYGNWANLGRHILAHLAELPILAVLALVMMAVPYFLHRWPVTVGPVALLGALVVIRYTAEAMEIPPSAAAAWSSTVGVLLCGFYLGGIGPRLGLAVSCRADARRLFGPALVIGWAWRFWVFLASLLSATVPFYKTHFFDPSGGRVALRLARLLGVNVVAGFICGVIVWGIAAWIARATRPTVIAT